MTLNYTEQRMEKMPFFVENEKLRLTSCQLLLPKEDSMCIACKKSHHYLRILTSRRKAKRTVQHPEKG